MDEHGCPILTLFLTGHRASDEYRTRQKRIRDAFDRVTALVDASATAESVAREVGQAWQRLRDWVSGVDLRREDER